MKPIVDIVKLYQAVVELQHCLADIASKPEIYSDWLKHKLGRAAQLLDEALPPTAPTQEPK
jgi:hypothetical protein